MFNRKRAEEAKRRAAEREALLIAVRIKRARENSTAYAYDHGTLAAVTASSYDGGSSSYSSSSSDSGSSSSSCGGGGE